VLPTLPHPPRCLLPPPSSRLYLLPQAPRRCASHGHDQAPGKVAGPLLSFIFIWSCNSTKTPDCDGLCMSGFFFPVFASGFRVPVFNFSLTFSIFLHAPPHICSRNEARMSTLLTFPLLLAFPRFLSQTHTRTHAHAHKCRRKNARMTNLRKKNGEKLTVSGRSPNKLCK